MGTPDTTAPNTPEDETGDGPVTIEDRVEPGGEGSPGTNQGKTEPMSPSGYHSEPMAPPDLEGMNVGAADPQRPRHPAAVGEPSGGYTGEPVGQEPTGLSGPGATPDAMRPTIDTTTSTGRAPGPEMPVQQDTTGVAHRVPGLQGSTPDGESVETDVSAGAARMGPQAPDSTAGKAPGQGGDAGVPSSGSSPAQGTSEEHRVVAGVKLPEADEA
jgi:hypothetical protein